MHWVCRVVPTRQEHGANEQLCSSLEIAGKCYSHLLDAASVRFKFNLHRLLVRRRHLTVKNSLSASSSFSWSTKGTLRNRNTRTLPRVVSVDLKDLTSLGFIHILRTCTIRILFQLRSWIPKGRGYSLYIRPTYISTHVSLLILDFKYFLIPYSYCLMSVCFAAFHRCGGSRVLQAVLHTFSGTLKLHYTGPLSTTWTVKEVRLRSMI